MFAFVHAIDAHTVPTLVVEAEFSIRREVVLKVNLDPRLFLSVQPASLPPVPATWWFEQDDAAKAKTMQSAGDYVERHLIFRVGSTPMKASWKVQPIDSASAFPLGQASAEVHLLAEHHGPLPDVAGEFKVSVSKDCGVAVILLNSLANEAERRPQSLFPGESSRGFVLPPPAASPSGTGTVPSSAPAVMPAFWFSVHFAGDHLALAALLGLAMQRRFWRALGLLCVFHGVSLAAAWLTLAGWLPQAPVWMQAAYWVALGIVALQLLWLKNADWRLAATLAVAGLCHGLNTPHLHLGSTGAVASTLLPRQEMPLLMMEALLLVALCPGLRALQRLRQPRKAVMLAVG